MSRVCVYNHEHPLNLWNHKGILIHPSIKIAIINEILKQ